jgi:uncharacterized protein YdbL (DUF1318 family)
MRNALAALSLSLLFVCGALSGTALAQSRPLDAPRAAGLVGEKYDGFALLRNPGAPADIKSLVDQANQERGALYKQRAASDGATSDAVGRIYAKQIFDQAPAGTWFLQESGQWVQKK